MQEERYLDVEPLQEKLPQLLNMQHLSSRLSILNKHELLKLLQSVYQCVLFKGATSVKVLLFEVWCEIIETRTLLYSGIEELGN